MSPAARELVKMTELKTGQKELQLLPMLDCRFKIYTSELMMQEKVLAML